ncbi:hypothetical protein XCR1_1040014 [Xenorhabdus cabanillasii JM26]|uniref:Uncharacterized protein n=1 Tax=Xenorhabdus cabanillasii JM26 TaxID=1427517 RepID=W1IKY2_9GAMM|nr:hypothetical protein XCR1_1040014 [Xenorhabdus cabanillasii JM26]
MFDKNGFLTFVRDSLKLAMHLGGQQKFRIGEKEALLLHCSNDCTD